MITGRKMYLWYIGGRRNGPGVELNVPECKPRKITTENGCMWRIGDLDEVMKNYNYNALSRPNWVVAVANVNSWAELHEYYFAVDI